MVKMQALGFRVLFADMLRNPVDILHQFHRVLKGVGIDPLHQIGFDLSHACAVVADIIDLIGMIDIAHFHLVIGEKRTRNPKGFSHLQQFTRNRGIHGCIQSDTPLRLTDPFFADVPIQHIPKAVFFQEMFSLPQDDEVCPMCYNILYEKFHGWKDREKHILSPVRLIWGFGGHA